MTIDVTAAASALRTLAGIDYQGALTALETGNIQGDITSVEEIAGVIRPYFPEAQYLIDALALVQIVVLAYQMGWIKNSSPDDPVRDRAAGPAHGGNSR